MMTEDLSVFFNGDDFAVEATASPGGVGSVIFDENGVILQQMGIETSGPSLICPASQWPSLTNTGTVTIGLVTYKVRSSIALDDGAIKLLALAR